MSENKTEETKAEEPEQKEEEIQKTEDISENSPTIPEETVPMEVTEEGGHTPPNEEIVGNQSPDQESDFMGRFETKKKKLRKEIFKIFVVHDLEHLLQDFINTS